MTVFRQQDVGVRKAIRESWLPALERELKRRVGWVDEAVSPFAATRQATPAPRKIQRDIYQPGKAA
jgi:hypothetical protein